MIFYTIINANTSRSEQHEAAYALLEKALKITFEIENPAIERSEKGKPFMPEYPDIHFNLSHCTGLVVCGISSGEIGVDAELIRPYNGKAAERIFSENEKSYVSESSEPDKTFFRIWTLKEALGKAIGTGISSRLTEYEFVFSDDIPSCKAFSEKNFYQKILFDKWVVSVCSDNIENSFEYFDLMVPQNS